jgi:hypothetical protein
MKWSRGAWLCEQRIGPSCVLKLKESEDPILRTLTIVGLESMEFHSQFRTRIHSPTQLCRFGNAVPLEY